MVERAYPQAVQIVDWRHAEEYLEKVAQEAFPEGEQRDTWLQDCHTALGEGDSAFVIRACTS